MNTAHCRAWLIGVLVACLLVFWPLAGAANAAAAEGAGAAGPVDWPPAVFVPDAHLSVRENAVAMLNYLADHASAHADLLLLAHHFHSLALVLENYGTADPQMVDRIYGDFMDNWKQGAASWTAYLNGRPMMFAWKSPYDSNIGVEYVMLPKQYNPKIAYPLYFELHAVSPANSPQMVVDFAGARSAMGNAGQRRDGWHVYPWARGLTEYHSAGIIDVDEALQQVDNYLNYDPARQYLFGFSMGGGGTWNYGALSMKKRGWAALGIYSGTTKPHQWEAEQLRHTPIWINCGQTDPWRGDDEAYNQALIAAGNPPEFFEVDLGVGHAYRQDYQNRLLDWLASKVNPHPVMAQTAPAIVHVMGDDALEALFINGQPVQVGGGTMGLARIHQGENTIAVKVTNRVWTGGLTFALELPDGSFVPSDGSWKVQIAKPADDWTSPKCDDSDWPSAGVLFARAAVPATRPATRPDDVFNAAGSAFIGVPKTICYRTEFTSAGGDASMKLRGVGTHFHVWLNGQSIGEDELKQMGKGPLLKGFQTAAGKNVLAMEITTVDPQGQEAEVKAGFFYKDANGDMDRIATGPGWRYTAIAPKDWTATAFDDSKWPITDDSFINAAYDGGADGTGDGTFTAQMMAPGEMWFRKTFTVAHLTTPTPAPVPATQPAKAKNG